MVLEDMGNKFSSWNFKQKGTIRKQFEIIY